MRTIIKQLTFFFIAIVGLANVHGQRLDHVLGEVLVEVRDDKGLNSLFDDMYADEVMRSTSLEARQIMTEPMNVWLLKVDPNQVNEIRFLNKVIKNKNSLLAQQNHITQLRTIPNDPNFVDQWQYINTGQSGGLEGADIDMDLAWDVTTGGLTVDGDSIVVCVIDDGINIEHPDLGSNLWINHQEIANNGIDDDGNGYVDDVQGWNAKTEDDNVDIDGGHGTPVAGIVGAKGNNDIGVAGVNWDVKLMIVLGGGPEDVALASYAYPYTMRKLYNETNGEKGAFVVATNASWGVNFGMPEDAPIWCDFYNSLGEVGVLNFGATINSNTNVDTLGDLPTTCESNYLVSVTNMNRQDQKVSGAGFGERHIDLGAFGAQTYTISTNSYGRFGGTSAAAPHVAATAALLYATDCTSFMELAKTDPSKAALVIKDCILHGVDYNESLQNFTTTGGRLNANNAVQNLISTCGDCTSAFGGDVGQITDSKGILTWFDNGNLGTTSIRYKVLDEIDWIVVGSVTSGYQFDNLLACSSYEYQTKTICPSNPNADYTYSRVFKTDGCCEIPSGISIVLNNQVATVQWDNFLAVNNFIVEWKNAQDTTWIAVDLGLGNTFLIEGILDCEFYDVRIKSECDGPVTDSEFSDVYYVNSECGACTKDYCSFNTKKIDFEWIDSVEIVGVFTNTSGVNENGYGNFLGNFDISLNAGQEYTLNLAPGYTGTQYSEFFTVYIDYNFDGEFDESERIFKNDQSATTGITGVFTVPADVFSSITRMRVVMRDVVANGPCDQPGYEFGEIEDYCVTINGTVQPCPTTFESMVEDITETSLTFDLTPNDLIQFYFVLLREQGVQKFDTISSNANQLLISNLTQCTFYEYRTGFICEGDLNIDADIKEVKTLCDVATDDSEEFADFKIFPNPSYGDLIIDFGNSIKIAGYIDLISSEGKSIMSQRKFSAGETVMTIDANEIPSGIYFLKATFNDQFVVRKWVKY